MAPVHCPGGTRGLSGGDWVSRQASQQCGDSLVRKKKVAGRTQTDGSRSQRGLMGLSQMGCASGVLRQHAQGLR